MKIGIIGQGNVASHLVQALKDCNHQVVSCGGRVLQCPVPEDADVLILAVKDDAISSIPAYPMLTVHTSGSIPMSAIHGERRGVLYPMQTFTKGVSVDISQIPFFVEAQEPADQEILLRLASDISTRVQVLDSERRRSLHLAAVLCNNFVNNLYDHTARVLEENGLDFSIMLPLIDETARKVHSLSPRLAQTGPAVRWDTSVMQAHQEQIQDPLLRQIYALLSESIHQLHQQQ